MSKPSIPANLPLRTTIPIAMALVFFATLYLTMLASQVSNADDSGSIEITLSSSLPNISEDSPAYALSDARFGIFSDYQCTQAAGEVTTDENGHASSGPLEPGRYFIRQELASKGFARSDRLIQADVAIGRTTSVEASETPNYALPDVIIRELNAETGKQAGVAGARLGKARYVVSYFSSDDSATLLAGASRSWTFESDDAGEVRLTGDYLVEGSPLFTGPQDLPVFPVGHYTVYMQAAPTGFVESGTSLACDVVDPDADETDPSCEFGAFDILLQPIRGDVMFRKVDENLNPLAGIPFMLSYANGEEDGLSEGHVIITDENGDFTSDSARTPHTQSTNANDAAVTPIPGGMYKLDEAMLAPMAGTWFSLDSSKVSSQPEDARGALPYGSYTLQELPCSANEGMNLATLQFSIYRDGFTVALDNVVDTVPALTSFACDGADGDKLIRPAARASVADTVSYRNLVVGKKYTLTSSLVAKETGETLCNEAGEEARSVTQFVATEKDGRILVELEADLSAMAGRQVSVCHELVADDGMVIALSNAEEGAQIIDVEPIIHASAHDLADKDKYVMGPDAVVVEHIEYDGLIPGKRYLANAILNDEASGSALRDSQGQVIDSTVEFKPDETTGYVDIELPVDTTGVAGHDLVVFDRISDEAGALVASHQDLEDEEQTVKTVKISTSACDKADGDKLFDSSSHGVTIIDTVKYANLVVGEQYELHGVLMDKETGKVLNIGGSPVSANVPFVPQEVSGSVDVELGFDAAELSSDVLVAFETLMHDGNVIAEHADLEDVAQTVTSQDIDAEPLVIAGETQALDAYGTGKGPKTGDMLPRALGFALIALAFIAATTAYATHRRRRTLEAIQSMSRHAGRG